VTVGVLVGVTVDVGEVVGDWGGVTVAVALDMGDCVGD
jgi:hypothetical protein